MSYQLEEFCSDCRRILSRDPGPAGREEVRLRLEQLLRQLDFVARYCGDDAARGIHVIYEDPELGFQVLAHINENGREGAPHDHGYSWAIYGQATQYTDVTEWARRDDGSVPGRATVEPVKSYRLTPGHAGIYQDGMIHSIAFPPKSRYVRVTGTNLDKISRSMFDAKAGTVRQMDPPRAA